MPVRSRNKVAEYNIDEGLGSRLQQLGRGVVRCIGTSSAHLSVSRCTLEVAESVVVGISCRLGRLPFQITFLNDSALGV